MSSWRDPPRSAVLLEKQGHHTYHLAPVETWNVQQNGRFYTPESFEHEGFIHCTDPLDEVIAVGNRYYQSDTRPHLVVKIDCASVSSPIVYEDQARIFPHIYGPLELAAVVDVIRVRRDAAGRFVGFVSAD